MKLHGVSDSTSKSIRSFLRLQETSQNVETGGNIHFTDVCTFWQIQLKLAGVGMSVQTGHVSKVSKCIEHNKATLIRLNMFAMHLFSVFSIHFLHAE